MRQRSGPRRSASEKIVKDIQRATRKQYSAEEKIRIVLDGLRGEDSIDELCRLIHYLVILIIVITTTATIDISATFWNV